MNDDKLTHEQYRLILYGMIIGGALADLVGSERFHDSIIPDVMRGWGFPQKLAREDNDDLFERLYVELHGILQKNHPDLVAAVSSGLFERNPSKCN